MELDYARVAVKGFPQPTARVYLMTGSDDALKREAVQRLTEPLLDPSMADFDREERDAPASSGDEADFARQVLASAAGAPMLSERRVVIVTNVQRLGKEDQETLAAGLARLGAQTCLVLVAGAQEYDAGKPKGKSVGAKLAKAIDAAGVTVLCDASGEGDLSTRARALVKVRGKSIEPEALRRVLDRSKAAMADRGGGKGGDLNVMTNELEKALAYVGVRETITLADVVAVGTQSAEEHIFALLDAVGHRNAPKSLDLVDEMLRAGGKPDGVAARTFVMVARHLRQVWAAKYLAEKRLSGDRLPPDVQMLLSGEMLGITQRQSYRLRGLQEQARAWSYEDLQGGLARTLASDMAMKGIPPLKTLGAAATGDDPASNLRLLVVDLCRK